MRRMYSENQIKRIVESTNGFDLNIINSKPTAVSFYIYYANGEVLTDTLEGGKEKKYNRVVGFKSVDAIVSSAGNFFNKNGIVTSHDATGSLLLSECSVIYA